jgi:hypothetical protein
MSAFDYHGSFDYDGHRLLVRIVNMTRAPADVDWVCAADLAGPGGNVHVMANRLSRWTSKGLLARSPRKWHGVWWYRPTEAGLAEANLQPPDPRPINEVLRSLALVDDPPAERRKDADGKVWDLLKPAFERWDGERVVIATLGWEQEEQVRRDLHILEADWESWEVVGDA